MNVPITNIMLYSIVFTGDNLQLIYPKIHDIVAVFSSRYRGIYRAKIISQSTLETNKYNCVLIDNGQYETIVYKNIFMLPNYIISNKVRNDYNLLVYKLLRIEIMDI